MLVVKEENNFDSCCICFGDDDVQCMFDQHEYELTTQDHITAIAKSFQIHLKLNAETANRNMFMICKHCINALEDAVYLRSQIHIAYRRDLPLEENTFSKDNIDHCKETVDNFENCSDNIERKRNLVIKVDRLETLRCCCCYDNKDLRCMMETYNVNDEVEIYANMIAECYSIEFPKIIHLKKSMYMLCKNCIRRLKDAIQLRLKIQTAFSRIQGLEERQIKMEENFQNDSREVVLDRKINYHFVDVNNISCFKQENQNSYGHMMIESDTNDFVCNLCGIKSKHEMEIIDHIRTKHSEIKIENKATDDNKKIELEIEYEKLSSKNKCERRIKRCSKRIECVICKKLFSNELNLKIHLRFHIGSGHMICIMCCKVFNTIERLKRHIRLHSKMVRCNVCGIVCKTNSILKRHIRVHENEKKYICDICNKCFYNRTLIKIHMVTHSGMQRKGLTQKSNLIRNMLTHSNTNTFETIEKRVNSEVGKGRIEKSSLIQKSFRFFERHFIEFIPNPKDPNGKRQIFRRCKKCYERGKRKETRFWCPDCKAPLCILCFKDYHTMYDVSSNQRLSQLKHIESHLNAFQSHDDEQGKELHFTADTVAKCVEKHKNGVKKKNNPKSGGLMSNQKSSRFFERHFIDIISNAKNSNIKRPIFRRCKMCYERGIRKETKYWCPDCKIPLCNPACFKDYHTICDKSIKQKPSQLKHLNQIHKPDEEHKLHFIIETVEKCDEKCEENHSIVDDSSFSKPFRFSERHFVDFITNTNDPNNKRQIFRRCKMCYKDGKRKETKYWCSDCKIPLCIPACFKDYHTICDESFGQRSSRSKHTESYTSHKHDDVQKKEFNFTTDVEEKCVEKYRNVIKEENRPKNGKLSSNQKSLRFYERHFIDFISNSKNPNSKRQIFRKCKRCYEKGKRKETKYWCSDCKIPLCIPTCFKDYHTL